MKSKALVVRVALFLIAGHVLAGTTGKIAGIVKDAKTGEPMVGANIVLQGTMYGSSTDLNGYYVILNIPPGTYSAAISFIGYAKTTIEGIKVSNDLTTKVDVALQEIVLESQQEVVVTAERPIIRKDLTSSESRVDAGQIRNLPVQEVGEVLALDPLVSLRI